MADINMNYDNFDLNLIKTFVAVYESGGIVNASKKLYISQPAVTASIKKLENIVSGKLFVRLPKGVKPTPEGKKFYQYCKSALNKIKLGVEEFENFSSLSKGQLSIGASHDVINYILMSKIEKFLKDYPNININFVEIIPKKLSQYLANGEIDIAFLEDETIVGEYNCLTIEELENTFFISKNFNTKEIDIFNSNYSFYKKNSGNNLALEKLVNNNNLKLNAKFTVSNFATMEKLCKINNCIGFAPKKYVDTGKFDYVLTDFKSEKTKINMFFPKNENISFVSKVFINLFKEV